MFTNQLYNISPPYRPTLSTVTDTKITLSSFGEFTDHVFAQSGLVATDSLCPSGMDVPRLPSPPSIRVYDQNPGFERCSDRHTSERLSSPSYTSEGAMMIPGALVDDAPPPLPPPRFNQALAHGHDLGWNFANASLRGGFQKSTLAPIRQGSSLCGGYTQHRLNTSTRSEDQQPEDEKMQEPDRNGSTVSTLRALSQPDLQTSAPGTADEERGKPASPSSVANQRLQGEKPLAQQSFQHSAEAYDKHLLSKIGKSNSPPRHPSFASRGVAASSLSRPPHTKNGTDLQRLSVTDPSATASFDPVTRWVTSPASAGISPGTKPGWRDYMDYRSSSVDSSAPSSAVDSDQPSRPRDLGRHAIGGLRPGHDDSSILPGRPNRGSHDQQALSTDPDTCFPMEEAGGLRRLNLVDRTPPHNSHHRQPLSKQQGLKRRALSPPLESTRDDKASANCANQVPDLHQRAATGHTHSRSPNPRFYPTHGSVSSTSSAGPRNGSYASSVGPSVTGSSMTSMSSLERPSPRDTPPSSELEASQDYALAHPATLNPPSLSSHPVVSRSHLSQNPPESRSAGVARAMSAQAGSQESKPGGAPRIAGSLMCECCPKKPKKFENEEDLRTHMLEKQYKCAFCHNRFKNKNEAERHQNSLHLRRHSWSCAAISGYEAAFHLSTSPASQTANGPSADACGYCGEEFPNLPRDWDIRIEHLTDVHKFRECSQTKKFFRADHFRQHLKHSHAGTSGKWTNMLENACMKEESAAESPVSQTTESGEPSQPSAAQNAASGTIEGSTS